MDNATTVGTAAHGQAHRARASQRARFLAQVRLSQDHKVIGIQYSLTGLLFLLFGFTLMMLMRYQLAYPGSPHPAHWQLVGQDKAPGGIMLPDSRRETTRPLGRIQAARRGRGTAPATVGLLPLPPGNRSHLRGRRRRALRDPDGLCTTRERTIALSGVGFAAQLRRERGGGHDRLRAGRRAVRAVTRGAALVLGPPSLGLRVLAFTDTPS